MLMYSFLLLCKNVHAFALCKTPADDLFIIVAIAIVAQFNNGGIINRLII